MPRKKDIIQKEVDTLEIEEENEIAAKTNKKPRKKLPKETDAPWPRRVHRFDEGLGESASQPSLRNFVVGAVFLALLAYGAYYTHTQYDLFSFIRPSASNEEQSDIDLSNVSETQRECIEKEIGKTEYREIQSKTRSATLAEQVSIQSCLDYIEEKNDDEDSVTMPGDLPLADELAIAQGVYKWCLENGLGDALDSLIVNEREPTESESSTIQYCQTRYWDDSLIACLPSDTLSLTELGKVITYESAGLSSGFVADSSSVVMADGRIRVYFEGGDNGIMSAISNVPFTAPYESLTLQNEGTVINPGYSHPRAIVLDDGRTRLFARSDNAIYSFVSSDGFSFTQEEGTRIAGESLGFENITGVDVVKTENGYRMYIGNALASDTESTDDRPDLVIKSATSLDMLNWTVEEGVRLGAGSGVDGFETTDEQQKAQEADHPSALVTDEGIFLVSFRSTYGACVARSTDGVTFDRPLLISEETILPNNLIGGDPDILMLEPNIYLITSTGGGPTPESFIAAGILRLSQ